MEVVVMRLDPRRMDHWLQIMKTVARAAPPSVELNEPVFGRLRSALLKGSMEGWLFSIGEPLITIVTSVREDYLLQKKELIVYAAASLKNMSVADWDGCFEKLKLHAKSKGCTHISAYTIVPRVMKMAARMGGDIDTRYVSIPLGGAK